MRQSARRTSEPANRRRACRLGSLLALALLTLASAIPASASAFISTGDGGWVWQNPLPQGNSLYDVAFIDAMHGWAVGAAGTILATTDGGATWSGQRSGTTSDLNAVTFTDATHGWAVGGESGVNDQTSGGVILATIDGGATWAAQSSESSALLNDVAFADATHGWAVGYAGKSSTPGVRRALILATSDGGATWNAQGAGSAGSDAGLQSVSFVDATHGWAVGGGPGATILATTNGGATWKDQTPGSDADLSGVTLFAVAFPDVTHGWAVGYSGTILATTNGGATWRKQSSGVAGNLFGVAFADATHGWAVGGRTIFATTSGGFPPPAPIITSVSPPVGVTETVLTVTGSGFTGSGAVAFNGVGATDSSLVSDMLITATVPASATTGSITVTTPGGSGANASNFTVTAAPPSPTITLKLSGLTAGAS